MEKLIFKYLNNSLTEKESNELQQWLRKDKDNIKIFENIVGEWNLSQQYIDKTKKKILSRVLSHNESAVKEPNFQKVISIATLRKISIAVEQLSPYSFLIYTISVLKASQLQLLILSRP